MQKFKFFTLAIIAMLSVNLAWGASPITLDVDKFGFSGTGYTTKTYTTDGVTFTMTNGANNKGLAFKASATLTHNVAIPGKITNITLNGVSYSSSSSAGFYIYVGTSSSSVTTEKYNAAGTGTVSVDIDGSYTFLKIQNKSTRAMYTSSIVITYAAATPTITTSANSLAFGSIENNTTKSLNTLTVSGSNLTNNITFSITGTNASYFTVTNPASISKGSGTVAATAITVQYAPKATGSHTATLQIISSGATTKEVTLTGTATAPAVKYTVTFNAGSGTCSTSSSTESTAGAGVNLPVASPSSACGTDGWTFAGWATASQAETTTAPTLYAANSNYKPSSNCTLYAVYSKTESGGGGTPSLVKMAKGGTLADGDKIVIVANETTVALYQETTNNSYVNKWTFDNDIETVLGNDKNWLTVTATTDGFTLGDATNGYIYNSSNNLYCGETTVDWELEDLDDGTFKLTTDGRYLSYRSDLSNQYWRMGGASGGTSGQTVLDIYKISASSGTTTYNSNPSCATCTNLITIAKGTPSRGSFTLTGAGTDICADVPVTVTLSNITADPHYHATAVTTSATTGGGTPSAITDGSATVSYITASTTINVTFAEDTKVVVTLLNNNNPVNAGGFDAQGKKEYYTGETLGTLPTLTSSDACDATSVTFMGWTTEQITTKRAAAPSFVTPTTPVTGNMTLRAVWARGE